MSHLWPNEEHGTIRVTRDPDGVLHFMWEGGPVVRISTPFLDEAEDHLISHRRPQPGERFTLAAFTLVAVSYDSNGTLVARRVEE